MSPKYLRKRGTSYIIRWSEIQAKKDNMEPIDAKIAEVMLGEIRKKLEAKKAMTDGENPTEADYLKELISILKDISDIERRVNKLVEDDRIAKEEDHEAQLLAAQGVISNKSIPTEEELYQEKIDADRDVIKIRAMTTLEELQNYMLTEHGEKVDSRKTNIEKLRKEVIERRVERIEEK